MTKDHNQEILLDICDAVEQSLDVLRELSGRPQTAVAAPAVTVQAPDPVVVPAPEVTVEMPPTPKRWTVEVTARDSAGRIQKLSLSAVS
jgi:hypothetical protein